MAAPFVGVFFICQTDTTKNMSVTLSGLLFMLGYAAIALEHKLLLSKAALALLLGSTLWIIAALAGHGDVLTGLTHAASDVFAIVIFLLAAMSLVEVLAHYRFFDVIRGKLDALRLDDARQFLAIALLTFVLSAFLDNLTTTIVMIQIARKFFKGENLLYVVAGIIIAANAGGAFSPIGDVTTIMLWFAKKFTSLEIIVKGFLPALALWIVSTVLLWRNITQSTRDDTNEVITHLSPSEKTIIGLVLVAFMLPVVMNVIGLPPYLGLLIGLGMVWFAVDACKRLYSHQTHLTASIDDMVKKVDIPSLQFFIGILFAVAALHQIGVLDWMTDVIYGHTPSARTVIVGNIGLGLLSAVFDNVPLTAMAVQILPVSDPSLWVLLALTVGTGGSLFVIGSAAGVVAMGMVRELNFAKYFKIAFIPATLGYAAAISVWSVQYFVLGF